MYLYKLNIEGFRKIQKSEFFFSNATFLVGANNSSKSTVLKAIEILLNSEQKQKLDASEFLSFEKDGLRTAVADQIIITGEFRNIPTEYSALRGFKGRIISYPLDEGSTETGNSIIFRKSFEPKKEVVVEILSKKRNLKSGLSTFGDYISNGLTEEAINEALETKVDEKGKPTVAQKKKLEEFDELFDLTEEDVWDKNPGGFLSVFMSKLPRFVEIPALHSHDELTSKGGAMQVILSSLFDEVRGSSENYQKASQFLEALAGELDPRNTEREFGRLLADLNKGFDGVFPGAKLNISVDLSDPQKSILPVFNIEASSNIKTPISSQGTGLSRSALFNLLKFRAEWAERKAKEENRQPRSLLIAFEEPELYLHPSAQTLIRNFIYDLVKNDASQIVATTHSTSMIDLSRDKAKQVINHLRPIKFQHGEDFVETIAVRAFNIHDTFKKIQDDDKSYVKMLMRVDDTFSRAFFTEVCVFFEGDSEKVALDETLRRLEPNEQRKLLNKYSLISARGKASIIPLIRYAKAIGLNIHVMHDKDTGTPGAEVMNEPIRKELNDDSKLFVLEDCIEDILGADRATSEKPYKVYRYLIDRCGTTFEELPEKWRVLFNKVFP
jgi:putative ATP-dependent endonuclease of OLD family